MSYSSNYTSKTSRKYCMVYNSGLQCKSSCDFIHSDHQRRGVQKMVSLNLNLFFKEKSGIYKPNNEERCKFFELMRFNNICFDYFLTQDCPFGDYCLYLHNEEEAEKLLKIPKKKSIQVKNDEQWQIQKSIGKNTVVDSNINSVPAKETKTIKVIDALDEKLEENKNQKDIHKNDINSKRINNNNEDINKNRQEIKKPIVEAKLEPKDSDSEETELDKAKVNNVKESKCKKTTKKNKEDEDNNSISEGEQAGKKEAEEEAEAEKEKEKVKKCKKCKSKKANCQFFPCEHCFLCMGCVEEIYKKMEGVCSRCFEKISYFKLK